MAHLVIRTQVAPAKNYTRYRQQLRIDFWYSCAYCSITELEASAIGFCIDHFVPQATAAHLVNEYSNLMWSCARCNGLKADLPTTAHVAKGFRFIRVDQDEFLEHLEPNGVLLKPLTPVGFYSHRLLYLDSQLLQRIRELRRRTVYARSAVGGGIRYLKNMSIDRLPQSARAQFLTIRRAMVDQADAHESLIERALLACARSPNLDIDPNASELAAERRQLLRHLGAPDPEKTID